MTHPRLAHARDLTELRAELAASPRLAIDTEFHAERRYLPQLYLVQLRGEAGRTWLVDALDPEVLPGIADVLVGRDWVLHGGQQDLRLLHAALGALPENVWDTQIVAGLCGDHFPIGYADLLEQRCGRRVDKSATMSDWSRRPLSEEQLAYAAADVDHLLELWDTLAADLAARGRADLGRAACRAARDEALAPPDPEWRNLGAAHSLDAPSAAAFVALASWREETARLLDTPARGLAADALLVEFARRRPANANAILQNRRVSKGFARAHGDDVVARIAAALAAPEASWPRVVRHGSPALRLSSFLHCWSEVEGHAAGWAPGLVLPRALLEAIVVDRPADAAGLADRLGWRAPLVAAGLWEALCGRRALVAEPLPGTDVAQRPFDA